MLSNSNESTGHAGAARTAVGDGRLPVRLTSFVGRAAELADLRRLVSEHRLVTLTGTGGVGKTRMAVRVAEESMAQFSDGAWWVDLASTTDPGLVTDRVARTLGLLDQPGRSAADTLVRSLSDRQVLMMLDNCEHLLDGCADLVTTLLQACTRLTVLATSREPLGVPGELTWRTPSLSWADEAVDLFTQRARLVRPDFAEGGADTAAVAEICRRLDGVPLALELAATRVRALSLTEIADGLHEQLQLLTSSARTGVPRHQTLRASVDWSHALLSDPERALFRRLAVFLGGFDLEAAVAVAGCMELPRHRIVDNLTQLVDKSLVVADNTGPITRYRMLETMRQYAAEKLAESGEADAVRTGHRNHYAAVFDTGMSAGHAWHIEYAEVEIDNLRAAFAWSREQHDYDHAARLASSLLPLWIHNRSVEGQVWFDAVLSDRAAVTPAARARALADKVIFEALSGSYDHLDEAEEAVAIARSLDDPALLAWALAAQGAICCYTPEVALPYFAEAIDLSPTLDDDWRLSQILGVHAYAAYVAGDLGTLLKAAKTGRELADAVGDWSIKRLCDLCIGLAQLLRGDLAQAAAQGRAMAAEGEAAQDLWLRAKGLVILTSALTRQGDTSGARAAADAGIEAATDLADFHRAFNLGVLVDALLAAGDTPAALAASKAASEACALPQQLAINGNPVAKAALASGDLARARYWADEVLPTASGAHRIILLENSIRVAIAQGDVERAEHETHEALAIAAQAASSESVPEIIECLAALAAESGKLREAARMLGSAAGIRERTGSVRFKIYDAGCAATVNALRAAMGQTDFDEQWAAGAALTTSEAVVNASRVRAERDRPKNGWAALTQAELNVALLVAQGLRSKDIAAQLFLSIRTVDTHITRIYRKLGVSSRVHLAREAARNG